MVAGLIVSVLIHDSGSGLRPVRVELVRMNKRTVLVKLPDGNIIKLKRSRLL